MVFSSLIFLFSFLPLLLAGYYLLPKTWAKNALLFIASLVFYAFGAGKLVILLLAVGGLTWGFSWLIVHSRWDRFFISLAILVFIGILIGFKYLGFIIDNLMFAGIPGLKAPEIVQTLGVSFFIFQAISYNLDVYRKHKHYEKNPLYVLLYICMFPQLISGPLVRYSQLGPQLKSRSFDFNGFTEGARRFLMGLGKKALIANPLSLLVEQILRTDISLISPEVAWTGAIAFTLQLFFDFSGYTDMAIGVGRMLGFNLPENFNYPYISRSITEFWRRWHMSLSGWLRDYLFTPMAYKLRRWPKAGILISLMVTFTLCGLWHGPTWNFIIWGALHGFFLMLETAFLQKILQKLKAFAIIYTMMIVVSSAVLVMTANLQQTLPYLKAMYSAGNISPLHLSSFLTGDYITILIAALLLSIPIKLPAAWNTEKVRTGGRRLRDLFLLAVFVFSVMAIATDAYNPFIYFRF